MKSQQNNNILIINDHDPTTGIGKYIFQIFKIFQNMEGCKYSFYMLMQNMKKNYVTPFPDITVQFRPFLLKGSKYGRTYDLLSYFYFPKIIPKGYSIYHISSQMMGNTVSYIQPAIITCHDIIPFRYKKNHKFITEYLRRKSIVAMTNASFIIFVSYHTKKDFLEFCDFDESKTAVIHEGASKVFRPRDKIICRKELGLPLNRPIILHIGTEAPRKNPDIIFRSLQKVKKHISEVLLIRIGRKRSKAEEFIHKLSLTENVMYFKSNQTEERLAKFYNAADVFLFPSVYEGFGLPALEALKSGCPLVASNATSIPEIAGDAAFLHDPWDVDGFADSIEDLLHSSSLSKEYSNKGLIQANKFSWEKAAQETLDVYDKII